MSSKIFYMISILIVALMNIIIGLTFILFPAITTSYFLTTIILGNFFLIFILNYIFKIKEKPNEFTWIKNTVNKSKNPMIFSDGMEIKIMNKACTDLFGIDEFNNLSLNNLFKDMDNRILDELSNEQKPSLFNTNFHESQSSYLILPSYFNFGEKNYFKLNIYPLKEFFSVFDLNKDSLTLKILDDLNLNIIILDEKRKINYLNKSSAFLLNTSKDKNLSLNEVIKNYDINEKFLEDISKSYQDIIINNTNYKKIRINDTLMYLKYNIFPIKVSSQIIGICITLDEKSDYTKALERTSISKVLQEHSDFGIYKYDAHNNLVELSEGASFMLFKEFKSKTISSDDFFSVIDKKTFAM